jgi:type II secretory ATPase GspE/PulE/Tfp pilus assembly ATPase PilB-like protein
LNLDHLKTIESQGDVVQLLDGLIYAAIERNSSDIHFESIEKGLRVRYRIDGVLYDQLTINKSLTLQILSRVKVLAHLNIAEKRVPQDGKFCFAFKSRSIDLRISTFPNIHGEKIVIRILDRSHNKIDLDLLGFDVSMLAQFHKLINRAQGFFLVTGPTGSGKTTTLYAALAEIASVEKNIVTLEDPVEYNLEGITQGQIHPEAGFTFEKGIRAILRQDPDIVMVGEIRDEQTAHIAIEAALTGHLVMSTLHTNDAVSAVMRLMDMGIEPFLINAALTGVLAQRLARKICTSCRTEVKPSIQERILLDRLDIITDTVFRGRGCSNCFNLGYKGRVGIFELLVVENDLRALIVKQPVFEAMYQQALKDGMKTLAIDGAQKVKEGIVSLQELARLVL